MTARPSFKVAPLRSAIRRALRTQPRWATSVPWHVAFQYLGVMGRMVVTRRTGRHVVAQVAEPRSLNREVRIQHADGSVEEVDLGVTLRVRERRAWWRAFVTSARARWAALRAWVRPASG